jgi:EAL domain-containing protein (putative c-di-GMP-specific phosphodiesterase class I)
MELNNKYDLSYFNALTVQEKIKPQLLYNNLKLSTALQPIYSLAHKRVVGYEALLRVKDKKNNSISPQTLFEGNKKTEDIIHLDRFSRYIHVQNFLKIKDNINWLFLNVSPQTIVEGKFYGNFFKELLNKYNFPAHRVVIEVVEHPIEHNEKLVKIVEFYKKLGCLIAIDDFGAGHSNFDRIWTLKPDIVKLDRSFLVKASKDDSIRKMLPGVVSLLHQSGTLTLVEGVETKDQAIIAIESNVDFVQGYYFGRPSEELTPEFELYNEFDELFNTYKEKEILEQQKQKSLLRSYSSLFYEVTEQLKKEKPLAKAASALLKKDMVTKVYLLDSSGVQTGDNALPKNCEFQKDKKFIPLDDAKSADWFRRHYLKRAVRNPDRLQVTRPYLSITGTRKCITLSMLFKNSEKKAYILCCDINVD